MKKLRVLTEEEAKEAAKTMGPIKGAHPQLPTKDGDYDEWKPPFAPTVTVCKDCGGGGWFETVKCKQCSGRGYITDTNV